MPQVPDETDIIQASLLWSYRYKFVKGSLMAMTLVPSQKEDFIKKVFKKCVL